LAVAIADHLTFSVRSSGSQELQAGNDTIVQGGHGGWWGAQSANGRMLMIGWALGDYKGPAGPGITFLTRLTLLREVRRLLAFSSYSSPLAVWPSVQPGLACSLASRAA